MIYKGYEQLVFVTTFNLRRTTGLVLTEIKLFLLFKPNLTEKIILVSTGMRNANYYKKFLKKENQNFRWFDMKERVLSRLVKSLRLPVTGLV